MKHITKILRESPDSSGGLALRRLLWSMWTSNLRCDTFEGCPKVNLWTALSACDEITRLELGMLVAMSEQDRTHAMMKCLESSGEWDRIEIVPAFERLDS